MFTGVPATYAGPRFEPNPAAAEAPPVRDLGTGPVATPSTETLARQTC